VTDVYNSDRQYLKQQEDQYYFQKRYEGSNASVLIDGRGKVILSAFSTDAGELIINVTDKNSSGKVTINTNGQVTIKSPKIQLNESDEPILLGNKAVKLISDILDQLAKESAGPYPILGQQVYAKLKESIDEIKSKLSFVK